MFPEIPPIDCGRHRPLLVPWAGESPRPSGLPSPLLRGKAYSTTLCKRAASSCRGSSSAAAASFPPRGRRGPAPLLERSAAGRGQRVGRKAERPRAAAAPWEGAPVPAPGALLSLGGGGGGPADPAPEPPQPPRCPCSSSLRPAVSGPATLFPGDQSLWAPGAARDPPWRPPRAQLRELGAPCHLTARPVNQRQPCAPSPPAATRPRVGLAWGGAPCSAPGANCWCREPAARMAVPRKHAVVLGSADPEV